MTMPYYEIELFILIFARITAILVILPVFGAPSIPAIAKIGLGVCMSVLFVAVYSGTQILLPKEVFPLLMTLAKEILVGLAIGFIGTLLFAGIQLAGELIAMQMGFTIANAIDPQTQQNLSLIAHFKNLIATMIFLLINGHIFLLSGIKKSFDIIPLMGASFPKGLGNFMIDMTSGIFIASVKIGAPMIAALLLTSVALGIAARVMPQMNVFFVGLPLKIGFGFFMIALSLPIFVYVFRNLYVEFQHNYATIIQLFH